MGEWTYNKMVIVGCIIFDGSNADIQEIDKSRVCINQNEYDEMIKYAEVNGLDWLVPADFYGTISIGGISDYNLFEHIVRIAYDKGYF